MEFLKRYRLLWLFSAFSILAVIVRPEIGPRLWQNTAAKFLDMLGVIPPIFVLLGLLDVWVPKETVMRWMGDTSGVVGILLSIVLGASSAGPLYGAFPFAAVMLKKGVRIRNVVVFLSAWATLKIPMFLFELSALGPRFAVLRWLLNIPVILFIAYVVETSMAMEERDKLRAQASALAG